MPSGTSPCTKYISFFSAGSGFVICDHVIKLIEKYPKKARPHAVVDQGRPHAVVYQARQDAVVYQARPHAVVYQARPHAVVESNCCAGLHQSCTVPEI